MAVLVAELDLSRPMIPFLLSRESPGKDSGRIAVLFLENYAIKYVVLFCSMPVRLSRPLILGIYKPMCRDDNVVILVCMVMLSPH
jgi:hypothetical protein